MKVGFKPAPFKPAPFKPATLETSYLQLGCLWMLCKMYDSCVITVTSIRGSHLVVTRLHSVVKHGTRIRGFMLHGLVLTEGGWEA